ncbi:MAG: hypothetical protein MJ078_08970, partial [Clostridia bacterium]|nr:hypothetical protein [Clostridia bacterium]
DKLLNRPATVEISKTSGAAGIAYWINQNYRLEGDPSLMEGLTLAFYASCKDSVVSCEEKIEWAAGGINVPIQGKPQLWWPRGYGDPNLYDGEVLLKKDGKTVARKSVTFGIRKVELVRTEMTDGKDGCFRFLVNGEEIMVKGTNWVPLDAFHSRDRKRLPRALSLLWDVGCNMVRCWGGNVYEDHPFFDACDRMGILVWQDFAMACNAYPQS